MTILNSFEVTAHWVSQSRYYLVMLRPTSAKFYHVIAYPKVAERCTRKNLAISNTSTFEVRAHWVSSYYPVICYETHVRHFNKW